MAPRLSDIVMERLDLVSVAEGKVLMVMTLRGGVIRTVFVHVPTRVPASTLGAVAQILNERLAGLSLGEVRSSVPARLRDTSAGADPTASELLNVFIQSADEWLQWPAGTDSVHLGRASLLADQPEFQEGSKLRNLIELTERTDLLQTFLANRVGASGLHITIGAEHNDPTLADFTVVTSEYHAGNLRGVIGVIGPTRMPYERVISLVESTSALVSDFLTDFSS
jgi:heat-inducible transcriptional repressor